MNDKNRPLNQEVVKQYVKDMLGGKWRPFGCTCGPREHKLCPIHPNGLRLPIVETMKLDNYLESWRKVWRLGIAPLLSTKALLALKKGLEEDDPRLIQGATTTPPPLPSVQDWPVEAACAIGYCGWKGEDLETVAEVEEFLARICFECDQRLGEPSGCRWFLNPFDEEPRSEFFPSLLEEVNLELSHRVDEEPIKVLIAE